MSIGKIAIIVIVVLGISAVGMIFEASHSISRLESNSKENIGVEAVDALEGKHFNLELEENVNVNSTP